LVEERRLVVEPAGEGWRLDTYLAGHLPGVSRSRVQDLARQGLVRRNGGPAKPSARLVAGDRLEVGLPEPQLVDLVPEDLPVPICYEDADLVVVNKPRGMVVHPAPGHRGGTLVNALLSRLQLTEPVGDRLRPGVVHRLDKDTTGLLVVAKNTRSLHRLAGQLAQRSISRVYLALVHGGVREGRGVVDAPLGRHPVRRQLRAVVADGRPARTYWEVRERLGAYTLLECRLDTGRTHQIRVHLAHLGHPVVGDPLYGPRRAPAGAPVLCLHACRLTFRHPGSGEEMTFTAPLPADFAAFLEELHRQAR
jgi:23S rRNA pseudouridine1911/1915/1917 synthase